MVRTINWIRFAATSSGKSVLGTKPHMNHLRSIFTTWKLLTHSAFSGELQSSLYPDEYEEKRHREMIRIGLNNGTTKLEIRTIYNKRYSSGLETLRKRVRKISFSFFTYVYDAEVILHRKQCLLGKMGPELIQLN